MFFSFLFVFLFVSIQVFASENFSENSEESKDSEELALSNDRQIFNPIIFLKDILDDKYPLRIDFGAEPHRHGSMVFGSVWYDWTNVFSSSLRGEYDHYMTFENSGENVNTNEVISFSFIPFPVVLFFGNPDVSARSIFMEVDIGFYIQNSHSNTNSGSYQEYAEKGFNLSETNINYTMIGPAFNISMNIPIIKYISVTSTLFFVPAYVLSYNSNSEIRYADSSSNSSISGLDLSSPYLSQSLCFDFFRYIRVKAQITYQHINMRQAVSEVRDDVRFSSHTLTLRYGGELLHPSKTRKKSAHLWGGLYYEMSWNKTYSGAASSNDYTGKWVLCFGT